MEARYSSESGLAGFLVEECGGSEVLQREAPLCPAGALTMSCLTPPEPRPQTPPSSHPSPPLHHQHRHPSNPKPTGRQRSAEAAAACLFNILKKLKYLCGLTHIHTQLRITQPRARRGTHARARTLTYIHTRLRPQYINK